MGGGFRTGQRPDQGFAEMTVGLYLDGLAECVDLVLDVRFEGMAAGHRARMTKRGDPGCPRG